MTFTRESKGGSRSRARVTTVRRLLVLVTLLFHDGEKKKREEEKKSIIYFAQTKQRATDMVDGERIKENVPLFRKGWLSIDGNCQSLPDRE